MDPKELRKLAEQVKVGLTAAQIAAAVTKMEQEKAKRIADEAKAQVVIVQIPSICEVAASQGEMSVSVMRVETQDIDHPLGVRDYRYRYCDPGWLKTVPWLVWEFCEKGGLKPSLEYGDDGVGIKSWFDIVVHW